MKKLDDMRRVGISLQFRPERRCQLDVQSLAWPTLLTEVSNGTRIKPRISRAGRAKIAAAQRLRWAKAKGGKVVSLVSHKRRKLSAIALAHIRTAQKVRWAKWRKQQKSA